MNTIVLLCSRISSRIRGWIAGQMLVRISPPMTGPPGCSSCGRTSPSRAMSSTGTTTWSSSGLRRRRRRSTTSRPSPIPPRNRAIVSSGRWVALRPIRWSGRGVSPSGAAVARRRSRRSRLSARCAPRLVPAIGVDLVDDHLLDAAQDLARLAREQEVQALGGRDEDVRRVADEVAPLVLRACRRSGWRSRSAAAPRPAAAPRARCRRAGRGGCAPRRRSAPSAARRRGCGRCPGAAFVGVGLGSWTSRSRHHRNAARVLPLPVGAWISVCSPRLMAAQPVRLGLRRGLERRLEPGPDRGPERREGIDGARDHGTASIGARIHFVQAF